MYLTIANPSALYNPILFRFYLFQIKVKDTHKENALINKTQVLTKRMKIDIWVISILSQLFILGSFTEIKFLIK